MSLHLVAVTTISLDINPLGCTNFTTTRADPFTCVTSQTKSFIYLRTSRQRQHVFSRDNCQRLAHRQPLLLAGSAYTPVSPLTIQYQSFMAPPPAATSPPLTAPAEASHPGSARQSHSPVTARSPSTAYRRFSSSRMSDVRDEDHKAASGLWAGRFGPSNKMGFGDSNERGGADDEAVDNSSSDHEGQSSRSRPGERRQGSRPSLKIEQASPAKKPRRKFRRHASPVTTSLTCFRR